MNTYYLTFDERLFFEGVGFIEVRNITPSSAELDYYGHMQEGKSEEIQLWLGIPRRLSEAKIMLTHTDFGVRKDGAVAIALDVKSAVDVSHGRETQKQPSSPGESRPVRSARLFPPRAMRPSRLSRHAEYDYPRGKGRGRSLLGGMRGRRDPIKYSEQ